MNGALIIAAIFLPIICGILLTLVKIKNRKVKLGFISAVLVFELAAVICLAAGGNSSVTILRMSDVLDISFECDGIGKLFSIIAAGLWLPAGIFAFKYMTHEENEDRFFGFFLMVEGALIGMDYAANLVCMYFLFEVMTFTALPLIIHNHSKEAMSAGMKYLFYSVGGAFMGLFGVAALASKGDLGFTLGGSIDASSGFIQAAVLIAVIGFGTKAGLYPMHGWLPTAHPVAPAPASAVLSAVIAKAGVLAVVRMLYFVVTPSSLKGTWVQYTLLVLAMLTVFMGSMMAYGENGLKKRLAYSTVSQISYVLIGVFLLSAEGLLGGLLHVVFHAVIKTGLFLFAGAVIFHTGKTTVRELSGIGKKMPMTLWGFVLLSLGLVGIPPASGFVSKWYLASASLGAEVGAISWLAPVILLISALLTAGYLFPIFIGGFFPGHGYVHDGVKAESSVSIKTCVLALGILSMVLGIFSSPLINALSAICGIGG